jgi:hypothetical protein
MPYTFNGCGTRYYGNQDKGEDGSYVTTEWVTFVYVPLIPLRSFRVLPVGKGTNYIVHASQSYQTRRVPLHWPQVRNVYLVIVPILLLIGYFNRQDIESWVRNDLLKPSHTSLQAEPSPVEPPLTASQAATACGRVLKLETPAFEKLKLLDRLSAVVANGAFTDEELKAMPSKDIEEEAFSAYSFAYLLWDKPTDSSRAEFDKMIVKVFNAQDLSAMSASDRALYETFIVKFRGVMLHAFELGRHDARMFPCPVSG